MYNEVDNDMQPFKSVEGEELFLFSGAKNSSIGTTFLQEDDDEHLRRQSNLGASASPHLQVDVDELLLSTNYIEPAVCEQHEDSLFWNCKDILEDHLNEILHNAQLNNNNNNNSSNNNNINNNNNNIYNGYNNQHTSNGVNQFSPNLQQHQLLVQAPQMVTIPSNNVLHSHHQQLHQQQTDFHQHDHIQQIHAPIQHQTPSELLQPQQQIHPRQQMHHMQPIEEFPQPQIDHHRTSQPIQIKLVPVVAQTAYIEPPLDASHQTYQLNPPQMLGMNHPMTEPIDKIQESNLTNYIPGHQQQTSQLIAVSKPIKQESDDKRIEKGDNTSNNNIKENEGKRTVTNMKTKIKEKQTRLDCPYCQRSFCKNFDLQQHMRCHTGEKPFQCIVCGRGFAQKSNVKKHMQAHKVWPEGPNHIVPQIQSSVRSRNNSACSSVGTKDEEYMQENESRVLLAESDVLKDGVSLSLDNNVRKNEVGDGFFVDSKYSCAYCSFNGRTYFELKSHLTVHKREKVFKCIVSSCGKIFSGSDLQSFLDHVKSHKNELIYHCHLCSSQFTSLNEFGQHQKSHNNTLTKKEQQALSNVNHPNDANIRHQNQPLAKAQQQMNLHTQQAHQLTQQPNSSVTNHNTISVEQSSNGMQRQSQKDSNKEQFKSNTNPSKDGQKYFRCSKCMNRYTTQAALDHHLSISSHHYPCTECDKVFPCERYLRRHLNTHTTNIHVCSFCDKQFKTAAYLKMHSVVHTGEKPFRCNQCDAAFNRRDKLNRHKLTHEPVKKFKCPFKLHIGCTKEFNRPDKLKAHLLTHSGVRPHPCDSCSRTFSRLSRLREHKKLHHGDIKEDNNNNNVSNVDIGSVSGALVCDNNKAIQTVTV